MSKKFWETWPKYVRTCNGYDEGTVYLIKNKDELKRLMLSEVTLWMNNYAIFGLANWYTKTYDDMFKERIGLTPLQYEYIMSLGYVSEQPININGSIKNLVESANVVMEEWKEYCNRKENFEFVSDIISGKLSLNDSFNFHELYDILAEKTWNGIHMFELDNFRVIE